MTVHELLRSLEEREVRLRVAEADLVVEGEEEALEEELLEQLRQHKEELMELLRAGGGGREREVPRNGIVAASTAITPEMVTLAELTQEEINRIVARVPGGAANVQDIYPLSPLQEGMLFHHLLAEQGDPYVLTRLLRFGSREEMDAYAGALERVMARHDVLRTAVVWEGLRKPMQVVLREVRRELVEHVKLERQGGDAGRQLYERYEWRRYRMDVREAPWVRLYAAEDEEQGGWVVLQMAHHLAGDHSAGEVLQEEIEAYLEGRGEELAEAELYRNVVGRMLLGTSESEHEGYFRRVLGEVEEGTLPYGLREVADGAGVEEAWIEIEDELSGRLRAQARRLGVTAASLFHLGWGQVLGRVCDREQVVFGTVLLGRSEGGERAARTMGLFINTLPLKVQVGRESVEAGAKRVHRELAELLGHEHASLALAQRSSGVAAPAPLFSSILNYRQQAPQRDAQRDRSARTRVEVIAGEERTNYPIAVSIDDDGERFVIYVQTQAAAPLAAGLAQRVGDLLHGAMARCIDALEHTPELPSYELDILTENEREHLLAMGRTRRVVVTGGFAVDQFEAHARQTPERIAVFDGGVPITYGELNASANRLARHLRALGVSGGIPAAVCAGRGPRLIVALLAILEAGGAYVPLDPESPPQRLVATLDAARPAVFLFDGEGAAAANAVRDGGMIPVDLNAPAWDALSGAALTRNDVRSDSPAYIIFTSGSTGEPKGVVVEQGHLAAKLAGAGAELRFAVDDVLPAIAPPAFDISLIEILLPLVSGGATLPVAAPHVRDVAQLVGHTGRATFFHAVPSLMEVWLDLLESTRTGAHAAYPALRCLLVGGEAVPARLLRRLREHFPEADVVELYGPTEATIISTFYRVGDAPHTGVRHCIGRPFDGTHVYVADRAGRLQPIGAAGELLIGGQSVARGYLGRPDLTAERFIDDRFDAEPQARAYRTGDVARWLPNGDLEFLGRNDAQVKIRGHRIELGEIEAALAAHPAIREAIVLVAGEGRLAAYVAPFDEAFDDVDEVRSFLRTRLPGYMVPAAVSIVPDIPRTSSGKVDRRALAVLVPAAAPRDDEPMSALEQSVAAIWSEVLEQATVGRQSDFFELGGHSLSAVRVIARVRERLEADVTVASLFAAPSLADFAAAVGRSLRTAEPPIGVSPEVERGALSFGQQRLWFLDQIGGARGVYHVPYGIRLKGPLDIDALRSAFRALVARHEILRTAFPAVDGEPVQRIAPADAAAIRLIEHDLEGCGDVARELRRVIEEEAAAPFDLDRGPLFRARLVRIAEHDHALLITQHHIICDGWSMGILLDELATLYSAFRAGHADPLPALPIQYADYSAWQRRRVTDERLLAQGEYWRRALAGAPSLLRLPADRQRPEHQDFAGDEVPIVFDAALTARLRALGRRHGTTPFMTLLAGLAVTLSRLAAQETVVVGTVTANRGRAELERLPGFFANTLALPVRVKPGASVASLLDAVKTRVLEAQQNQDVPFERVVELVQPARSLAHAPLFQAMLVWQSAPEGAMNLDGLEAGEIDGAARATSKFDLTISLADADDRIEGSLEFATALFDRGTAERYVRYWRTVLEAMAAGDSAPVDALPLEPLPERRRVAAWFNATSAPRHGEQRVHRLVEAQALSAGDSVAVVQDGASMSYAELNRRADRFAVALRAAGVQSGSHVALVMERSADLVVAMLAAMKAGAAYVPLDPSYPPERLRYILADGRPAVVAARRGDTALWHSLHSLVAAGTPFVDVESGDAATPDAPADEMHDAPDASAVAYVIYTSGSTGRPKGVAVEHRSLANLVRWHNDAFGAAARSSCVAAVGFDAAAWEIWPPLCSGGQLVLAPRVASRDPEALLEWWSQERLDVSFLPTPVAELAFERGIIHPTLRWLLVGGDRLRRMPRQPLPYDVVNNYGPTEATVVATSGVVDRHAPVLDIGRPVANAAVYVLDSRMEPAAIGERGELYVGGAGVARGYWNRPEETAQRFVPNPFGEGRLYRTGDLGRWLADGRIEYLGRDDGQVKVNGVRVETGEVETVLAEHPAIAQTVVVARDDEGRTGLVAYIVAKSGAMPEQLASDLRAFLRARLPDAMVPAVYVPLDSVPLTAHGKIDRAALPAPMAGPSEALRYEAPRGSMEEAIAVIWAELLRVDRVGRTDHFFDIGGQSLLAARVVARVRSVLGTEVTLATLFAHPMLCDFAAAVTVAGRAVLPPITPAAERERAALSFAQQRLWLLSQIEGVRAAYHVPFTLRLRGDLDRDALRRTLGALVRRHEVLRTTFEATGGEPRLRVSPPAPDDAFPLIEHDLRGRDDAAAEARRIAADEAAAPFDLERGPLFRARLVRIAGAEHTLLVTMHHIVADGWSIGVMSRDLNALYEAFRDGRPDPLEPLALQYSDYAAWQRKQLTGEVLSEQAAYWRRTLAGAPAVLELPSDRPRPATQDYAGATFDLELDAGLTRALIARSRASGVTLFMTLLAGWAGVLGRLAATDDLVIGTPVANRGRAELEGLIGFFVNTLPIRIDLAGNPTADELLQRVKAQSVAAQQHQDLPFEQIVELVAPERSLAHSPLFQVLFVWQSAPIDAIELPDVSVEDGDAWQHATAKFDLTLTLGLAGDVIAGNIEYAASLFDEATVRRYVDCWRTLLAAIAAEPTRGIDDLPLLTAVERQHALALGNDATADDPAVECVHELFERYASVAPQRCALVDGERTITYADLEERANRLAQALIAAGVAPSDRVAVCLERGADMVVALLAVLKSGAAYVPLDPAYPEERIAYMLRDSGATVVVADAKLSPHSALLLDPASADGFPSSSSAVASSPEQLAYVIYTSGSTGRPKGVAMPHAALVNLIRWQSARSGGECAPRTLQFAALGFDVAFQEIFSTICFGGTVILADEQSRLDPSRLVALVASQRVERLFLPVVALQSLAAHCEAAGEPLAKFEALREVIVAGETLRIDATICRFFASLPQCRLDNQYGPSETHVVTAHRLPADVAAWTTLPPIGLPIANARIYILDRRGEPVPPGVLGEICIGGACVARGYWNHPEWTAERFVPDPFDPRDGARMYKTGDLGRRRADGVIEFHGRNDLQLKLRGFRIEPAEIEARLLQIDGVAGAVVVMREDTAGVKRLVAYYTASSAIDEERFVQHLAAALPEYMVPAAYVRLEALPLTPNGKLDRRALPAPGEEAMARPYEPPAGETERLVAAIWANVLGAARVGRRDHFFRIGGHSLLAARVIARVEQALGVVVPLSRLFACPVLADFANGLTDGERRSLPPVGIAPAEERAALSFSQQRLWFLCQLEDAGEAYHLPFGVRLGGTLDVPALRHALDALVARHEIFRTTFPSVGGVPRQRVAPARQSRFPLVEQTAHGAAIERIAAEEAAAPFDLANGPLIRGRLVRLADGDHSLLITLHHILADGWSIGVMLDELSALYGAFRDGKPDPLPPPALQYADYAAWQRRWISDEAIERQADYWTSTLAGAPSLLELPADRPRPLRQDHAGDAIDVVIGPELTRGIRALSRRHGTTLFMTLLAAWAAVLARLSGQEDIVIGAPVANRRTPELERTIGLFVNTLALRIDLSGSPSVAELLDRARTRVIAAQQHQDIPFEQVVERVRPVRSLAHAPLFQVMFAWQNTPQDKLELPGVEIGAGEAASHTTAKFDLTLSLREGTETIEGGLEFATALFDRATVERHREYLLQLLAAMAAGADGAVDRIDILPAAERALVLRAWNRTDAPYPADACLHELFEKQARETPDAIAVSHADDELTYAALDARATALAQRLVARGIRPDSIVAICAERRPSLVVAVLAVLKAGGAYLPLDPTHPRARLAEIVESAAPALLLCDASGRQALPATPSIALDDAGLPRSGVAADGRVHGLTSRSLAYVIYTSGSTGTPKGVMIEHASAVNLLTWASRFTSAGERARTLFSTSITFDLSIFECFLPLICGGCVVMVRDAVELADRPRAVSLINTVPSAARALLDSHAVPDSVETLNVAGEPLRAALIESVFAETGVRRLCNLYGPTETTTYSTCFELRRGDDARESIGRPIANTRVYVLDAHRQPVPLGAVGEIYIGGAGVARGYLHRPELTAERFLDDPFAPGGGRMYRTGDLARHRADGSLEFLGRNDQQVKIRGFRIELGEIEARLASHPAIRESAVVAVEGRRGEPVLAAYVVPHEDAAGVGDLGAALREHLALQLPDYMLPATFTALEKLPRTPNGKLDRKALPLFDADALRRPYETPDGAGEELVAAIWSDLLRVDAVGRHDDFFELGGHSLLALQVVERLRRAGRSATIRDLFEHPRVVAFARTLTADAGDVIPPNLITPGTDVITPAMLPLIELNEDDIAAIVQRVPGGVANIQDLYALAPLQDGILFHHLLGGDGDPYLLVRLLAFPHRAAVDRFLAAVQHVVDRHDILRTSIHWQELSTPAQVVWRHAPLSVTEIALDADDASPAEQLIRRFDPRHYRMDLGQAPLLRYAVAREPGSERWLLVELQHHIIGDHATLEATHAEVTAILDGRAEMLGEPQPFRTRVARTRLAARDGDHEAFFRAMVGDVHEPALPFGLRDVHRDGSGIVESHSSLAGSLSARLRAQARRLGVTVAALCHVAWGQVVARTSGSERVVFGTVLFGRTGGGEAGGEAMGLFMNTLPIRLDLDDTPLEETVRKTHRLLAELLRREHASLALAQRCSGVSAQEPLFTALLNYRHNRVEEHAQETAQEIEWLGAHERTNYPLTLSVDDFGDALALTAQVVDTVSPEDVCELMKQALDDLAAKLESGAQTPARELEVLSSGARDALLRMGRGEVAGSADLRCAHEWFESHVRRAPSVVAVIDGDGETTYGELNARAKFLASLLVARGVAPDHRVAICSGRHAGLAAGLLAIWKTGGAYVPLDPSHPRARLAEIMADAEPAALLCDAAGLEAVGESDLPVIRVDQLADCDATAIDVHAAGLTAGHLAYVIYTSGSTGQPKGVAVEHRNLASYLAWARSAYPSESAAVLTSIAFDATITSLVLPLVSGGTTILLPDREEIEALARRIRTGVAPVGLLKLTPSHLPMLRAQLDESELARAAEALVIGGEALTAEVLQPWRAFAPATRLINEYGPTETVVGSTFHEVASGDPRNGSVPIGRPIAGARVYILDQRQRFVPAGVAGELYIGGPAVSRGYWNRPELTRDRFLDDPFAGEPGARMYRTGDVARLRRDGNLEYLGRNDEQIKLRGFRIEPGEIEQRIAARDDVAAAIVTSYQDGGDDRRLVAYVVREPHASLAVDALKADLAAQLPAHMVPSAWVVLDALPLTPNGKVDRKALPAPSGDAYVRHGDEEPQGEIETAVAAIWSELLGVARIGRHDNFFDLGGHSLLAVTLMERLRRRGLHADVKSIFSAPTVASFVASLGTATPSLVEVPPNRIPAGATDGANADVWELTI